MNSLYSKIISDLSKYEKKNSLYKFVYTYIFKASYKYVFWLRMTNYLHKNTIFRYTIFPFSWILWRHYSYKFGISIPYKTHIGYGFKINHFTGIIINSKTVIGSNVTICQGVTLGNNSVRGDKKSPIIKDGVYIAPGAKVFGGITVGDNCIVGANAVVTRSIEKNMVFSNKS